MLQTKKIENQPTRLKNFNLNLILTFNTYVYTCSRVSTMKNTCTCVYHF